MVTSISKRIFLKLNEGSFSSRELYDKSADKSVAVQFWTKMSLKFNQLSRHSVKHLKVFEQQKATQLVKSGNFKALCTPTWLGPPTSVWSQSHDHSFTHLLSACGFLTCCPLWEPPECVSTPTNMDFMSPPSTEKRLTATHWPWMFCWGFVALHIALNPAQSYYMLYIKCRTCNNYRPVPQHFCSIPFVPDPVQSSHVSVRHTINTYSHLALAKEYFLSRPCLMAATNTVNLNTL